MKKLITLMVLAMSLISQALEGDFWVKEVGRNSVVIAPLECGFIDNSGAYRYPYDYPTNDSTLGVGGSSKMVGGWYQEKKQKPITYIPWDKTNVTFKVGTLFHAEYTVTKKYGYDYFTVSKYKIIKPLEKK